jgi:hypothetical protein
MLMASYDLANCHLRHVNMEAIDCGPTSSAGIGPHCYSKNVPLMPMIQWMSVTSAQQAVQLHCMHYDCKEKNQHLTNIVNETLANLNGCQDKLNNSTTVAVACDTTRVNLETQVTDLEKKVEDLSKNVTELTIQQGIDQSKITALNNENQSLKNTIKSLKEVTIENLKTEKTTLLNNITTLYREKQALVEERKCDSVKCFWALLGLGQTLFADLAKEMCRVATLFREFIQNPFRGISLTELELLRTNFELFKNVPVDTFWYNTSMFIAAIVGLFWGLKWANKQRRQLHTANQQVAQVAPPIQQVAQVAHPIQQVAQVAHPIQHVGPPPIAVDCVPLRRSMRLAK